MKCTKTVVIILEMNAKEGVRSVDIHMLEQRYINPKLARIECLRICHQYRVRLVCITLQSGRDLFRWQSYLLLNTLKKLKKLFEVCSESIPLDKISRSKLLHIINKLFFVCNI
jgi:hypothetical protein